MINVKYIRNINIEKYLTESDCEVNNLQSYFPTLCLFERKNNKYSKWLSPELKNQLVNVTDYINKIGSVKTEKGYIFSRHFHIKYVPILDPIELLKNGYIESNVSVWMPTRKKKIKDTTEKVNSYYNSAYCESICSILTSSIVDNKYCPHFGSLYGIYNGIVEDYEQDFSEEYTRFKDESWFKKALKNKKCKIIFLEEFSNDSTNNSLNSSSSILDDTVGQSHENNTEVIINDDILKELDMNKYNFDEINNLNTKNTNSSSGSNYEDIIACKIILNELPVQIFLQEKIDITFDDLFKILCQEIKETLYEVKSKLNIWILYIKKKIIMKKLLSWIFQICVGLTCANHHLNFVHNDLHIENVMCEKTKEEFIYYKISNNYYKVPTHGYIMKIIDFGRATFIHNNELIMGDVFSNKGDAGDQYTYPYEQEEKSMLYETESDDESIDEYTEYDKNQETTPKFSFDLSRFSCSLIEELDSELWHDFETFPIGNFIIALSKDKDGMNLLNLDGFDLYKHLSRFIVHPPPIEQISNEIFTTYKITHIPKDEYMYNVI